jgi:hypothetical protein
VPVFGWVGYGITALGCVAYGQCKAYFHRYDRVDIEDTRGDLGAAKHRVAAGAPLLGLTGPINAAQLETLERHSAPNGGLQLEPPLEFTLPPSGAHAKLRKAHSPRPSRTLYFDAQYLERERASARSEGPREAHEALPRSRQPQDSFSDVVAARSKMMGSATTSQMSLQSLRIAAGMSGHAREAAGGGFESPSPDYASPHSPSVLQSHPAYHDRLQHSSQSTAVG